MNETPNPEVESGDQPHSNPPNPEPTPAAGRGVFDPLTRALRQGAEDARKTAEAAAPKVKSALADAAYHLAYGGAFAVSFSMTAARLLCPEVVKAGWRDGFQHGNAAAHRFAERCTRQADTAPPAAPSPIEPIPPAPQPGLS